MRASVCEVRERLNGKLTSVWAKWDESLFCHSASKWLTAMLSEQFSAFVIAQLLGPYSTSAGFLRLCTFVRERACTFFLYIRLSGLSSSPNGLMGTLWCLSNPLVWDTLRVPGSTKAQPCLWRRVPLWWGATAVLTVAGLMVITPPRGSTLWTLKTRTSPLHTPC